MGQYFQIFDSKSDGSDIRISDRSCKKDGKISDYCGAKLTEFSYCDNEFCRALAYSLINNPRRIITIGDYADDYEDFKKPFNLTWGPDADEQKYSYEYAPKEFKLTDYTIVNMDKMQICNLGFLDVTKDNLFPLTLLTAIGNGRGGGDFRGKKEDMDRVGSWAGDNIYLIDNSLNPDLRDYKSTNPLFTEGPEI